MGVIRPKAGHFYVLCHISSQNRQRLYNTPFGLLQILGLTMASGFAAVLTIGNKKTCTNAGSSGEQQEWPQKGPQAPCGHAGYQNSARMPTV